MPGLQQADTLGASTAVATAAQADMLLLTCYCCRSHATAATHMHKRTTMHGDQDQTLR